MKRTRLRARSQERIDEDWEWQQVKIAVSDRDRGCRAARFVSSNGLPVCGPGSHPHHVWPTGEGGPRLDVDNVIELCTRHHRWVHDENRPLASTLGLIRRG